jgi:hypothetical protein
MNRFTSVKCAFRFLELRQWLALPLPAGGVVLRLLFLVVVEPLNVLRDSAEAVLACVWRGDRRCDA